jgi:NADH-quinone oxidoreductase subunit H
MFGVGAYCFYRAPKQPVKVQSLFMVAVGLMMIVVAIILFAPLITPVANMLPGLKPGLHGAFWFLLKVGAYVYLFMWLRFTFPRYRFDQLMRLGWQFLIPLSIVNVMGIGVALVLHRHWGWSHLAAFGLTTLITLAVAGWLGWAGEKQDAEHVFVGET